ncbi:biotin transporter BioY [Mycetocola sp. 2940]|uniref:biotin transporter BioY n=1 Tax=Mycetocola sp. 2940 TaxID=3156452 RepID=UPI0033990971
MTSRLTPSDIARVAVFAAIIAVLGLPGGLTLFGAVPITAQTLGVMLAGAILGPWRGALSVLVLLALVALGLPLLAGGKGGAAVFVGPTAGYLVGWVLGAFVIGAIVHAGKRITAWRTIVGLITGGIVAIYLIGIPVSAAVTRLPLLETAVLSLGFLPGDLLKVGIATAVVLTLSRAYPRAFQGARPSRTGSEKTPVTSAAESAPAGRP